MRLAVLLALTSVAHAEPPKGSWTFDVAAGGGIRVVDRNPYSITEPVAGLSIGTGHLFADRIGVELQFEELVFHQYNVVEGQITMTIGLQLWPADHWFAIVGAGLGGNQTSGTLTGFDEDGYALVASGGYAFPIGSGSMLTVGIAGTHISAPDAPSAVTATIGFLSL